MRPLLMYFVLLTACGERVTAQPQVSWTVHDRVDRAALGYVSGSARPKQRYTENDDPKRLVDLDRMMQEGVSLPALFCYSFLPIRYWQIIQ